MSTSFCLLLSTYDVMRYPLQNLGSRAVGFQGVASLLHQAGGNSLRSFDAVQRRISGLVLSLVLANGLTQFGLRSQHVEQIVSNLKCQADLFPVGRNAFQVARPRLGQNRAGTKRRPNEGAGLGGVDVL